MTNIDDGGPAFPAKRMDRLENSLGETAYYESEYSGMTLRDWFAGQALSGMHARDAYDSGLATPEQRARLAYIDADAMIAVRNGGAQ